MTSAGAILLHGFGQRYDLPISLALYLYAAAGVVVISFVLVVLFAGEQVGAKALDYPRRAVAWLVPVARSPWPRAAGGALGVLGLLAIIVAGFWGSANPLYNPAEYLTWIYFWAATVILSGLVGNLWYLLNPWAAIYDVATRFVKVKPSLTLPPVGLWPAASTKLRQPILSSTTWIRIVTPGWLNRVLDEFRRHPDLVALSGPYIYYDAVSYTHLTLPTILRV